MSIKKIIFMTNLVMLFSTLVGCGLFGTKEQEFSGFGITITLDDTFVETSSKIAPFYLTSPDHFFMGISENKADAVSMGIFSLNDYAEATLKYGGYEGTTIYDSDGENKYVYAYYTATVDDILYGYMMICMESDSYFYLMNFGCLNANLDHNKEQYIAWANTISVE